MYTLRRNPPLYSQSHTVGSSTQTTKNHCSRTRIKCLMAEPDDKFADTYMASIAESNVPSEDPGGD